MSYEAILVRKSNKVGTITMNRHSALNYLDPIMAQEIQSVLGIFSLTTMGSCPLRTTTASTGISLRALSSWCGT